MPASRPPKNFLDPRIPRRYVRRLRWAVVEQVTAAIKLSGVDTSTALNAKVLAGFRDTANKGVAWEKVQLNPRAWNKTEVAVLWRWMNGTPYSPLPSEYFFAEEKQWKATNGKVDVSIICHPSEIPALKQLKVKMHGMSEPFTALIALNTRRNQIAAQEADDFGKWTTLAINGGPRLEYCATALYRRRDKTKCIVAVPVAQHCLPEEEGNWRQILEEQFRQLHQFANRHAADLEICCPQCPGCYWPDSAPT